MHAEGYPSDVAHGREEGDEGLRNCTTSLRQVGALSVCNISQPVLSEV